MKTTDLVATAHITINSDVENTWEALTRPELIKKYMFGTTVQTDWIEGHPITWKGEWKGKQYEDKGVIQNFYPLQRLQYSHFSPLSGMPDAPENYHTVTIDLHEKDGKTTVNLSQDHNETEEVKEHSEKNWNLVLTELKKLLEGNV